jgi:uncharacterized protein
MSTPKAVMDLAFARLPARLSVRAGLIASAGWAVAFATGMLVEHMFAALSMYAAFVTVVFGVPFYRRCRERFGAQLLDGLLGAGAGLLAVGATHVAWPFAATRLPHSLMHMRELYDAAAVGVALVPLLVLVPLVEELLWRGFLFEALLEQRGAWAAALLSTAAYTLAQGGSGSWLVMIAAAALGLLTSGLRLLTGGLLAPAVAHVIWTGSILVVFPLVSP